MAKAKKERAENYDEKLSIEGSFEDVIGVSVTQKNMKTVFGAKIMGNDLRFNLVDVTGDNPSQQYSITIESMPEKPPVNMISKENGIWVFLKDTNYNEQPGWMINAEQELHEAIKRNGG